MFLTSWIWKLLTSEFLFSKSNEYFYGLFMSFKNISNNVYRYKIVLLLNSNILILQMAKLTHLPHALA